MPKPSIRQIERYIKIDINEKQVVDHLINLLEGINGGYSHLEIFGNYLYGEYYLNNWKGFDGCYCLSNYLVRKLGINSQTRPGDIDVMLLPFNSHGVHFDKCTAIEVKLAKPNYPKIRKGANSDGYSQINGLVDMGFPFVGLLHVVIAEPIPNAAKHEIQSPREDNPREFEIMKWDWLPYYAENNQMRRLLSYDFPKYIGLKSISLHFYEDGSTAIGQSQDFNPFESAFLNPKRKIELLDILKNHFFLHASEYRKIIFTRP